MLEAELNRPCKFEEGFKRYRKFASPVYGECDLLKGRDNEQVIMKRKITNNQNEFILDLKVLANRKAVKHENLVRLLDYSARRRTDFCSTSFTSSAFYEYFSTNLREQIDLRIEDKHYFSERELVGFLYDTLDVLSFLQGRNFTHGDIRPELLFFEEENGKTITKLGDRLSEHSTSEECQLNHVVSGSSIYMSPEMYANLTRGKTKFNHNQFKSDAFSLGVIFLEMGCMMPIQPIYNKDRGEVSPDLLNKLFGIFADRYSESPLLCSAIKALIEYNEKDRSDCRKLHSRLPDVQEIKKYYDELARLNQEGQPNQQIPGTSSYNNTSPPTGGEQRVSRNFLDKPQPAQVSEHRELEQRIPPDQEMYRGNAQFNQADGFGSQDYRREDKVSTSHLQQSDNPLMREQARFRDNSPYQQRQNPLQNGYQQNNSGRSPMRLPPENKENSFYQSYSPLNNKEENFARRAGPSEEKFNNFNISEAAQQQQAPGFSQYQISGYSNPRGPQIVQNSDYSPYRHGHSPSHSAWKMKQKDRGNDSSKSQPKIVRDGSMARQQSQPQYPSQLSYFQKAGNASAQNLTPSRRVCQNDSNYGVRTPVRGEVLNQQHTPIRKVSLSPYQNPNNASNRLIGNYKVQRDNDTPVRHMRSPEPTRFTNLTPNKTPTRNYEQGGGMMGARTPSRIIQHQGGAEGNQQQRIVKRIIQRLDGTQEVITDDKPYIPPTESKRNIVKAQKKTVVIPFNNDVLKQLDPSPNINGTYNIMKQDYDNPHSNPRHYENQHEEDYSYGMGNAHLIQPSILRLDEHNPYYTPFGNDNTNETAYEFENSYN